VRLLLLCCAALQEEFSALLPLYLTAEHFNKALPHMEPLLRLLAPERVSAAACRRGFSTRLSI
jgi:hypothetical protein